VHQCAADVAACATSSTVRFRHMLIRQIFQYFTRK
jgi:hypothetical protein